MTVDASRSCLGLETCVGSVTRQIVFARVLLTAAAPPALPGSSVSGGSLAPPSDAITRLFRSPRRRRHAPGDGPDEAGRLAGDRGRDDVGRFAAAGKFAIARTQPQLRFPGDLADRLGLLLLPEQQFAADPGREAVGPGRFDQQPTGGTISGLGEAAAPADGLSRTGAVRAFERCQHQTRRPHQGRK